MALPIDIIFVPQGAEYQAVYQGLKTNKSKVEIIAIPLGITPVTKYLQNYDLTNKRVLLMGLAGSLSSFHQIGDVVLYESCAYIDNKSQLMLKKCDTQLTHCLQQRLNIPLVKGLTSDCLISKAEEKKTLAQSYNVNVVDMEGIAIFKHCNSVAILRVISDCFNDDLPDLNTAINEQGKLEGLKMAIAFLSQPILAMKLIKNSLKALKCLTKITENLNL